MLQKMFIVEGALKASSLHFCTGIGVSHAHCITMWNLWLYDWTFYEALHERDQHQSWEGTDKGRGEPSPDSTSLYIYCTIKHNGAKGDIKSCSRDCSMFSLYSPCSLTSLKLSKEGYWHKPNYTTLACFFDLATTVKCISCNRYRRVQKPAIHKAMISEQFHWWSEISAGTSMDGKCLSKSHWNLYISFGSKCCAYMIMWNISTTL